MPTAGFDFAALRQALERSDAATLAALYAEDAEMTIVDRNRPPSADAAAGTAGHRRLLAGCLRPGDDPCGRRGGGRGGRIAFVEHCAYPDGCNVVSAMTLDVVEGRIARHLTVQAWDEVSCLARLTGHRRPPLLHSSIQKTAARGRGRKHGSLPGPCSGVGARIGGDDRRASPARYRRAAEVGGHDAVGADPLDRRHQPRRGRGLAEMLQHHRRGPESGDRVGHALAGMSKAEPWIGSNIEGAARRVEVGGRRRPRGEPASAPARSDRISAWRLVATTVSMLAGLLHHAGGHGVDQLLLHVDGPDISATSAATSSQNTMPCFCALDLVTTVSFLRGRPARSRRRCA